jgi:uncharacterized membrane protein YhaH (DUF805 family)
MEWYLMVWKKFAQFSGRSRRKEYWMFFLFNTLIGIVLYGAGLALRANGIGKILLGLYFVYLVAVIIPCLAVSVRRLHDTGKSGWLFLLILIPIVGPIILLVFFMVAGNPGANEYGPDPKSA